MAYTRFNGNVNPFASSSTSTNRAIFGGVTQSDLINDNLNADFFTGWEIVGINDNPTKQDFNALGYTNGYLISYLYQAGIPEYNATQNYLINSIVMASDGNLYKSLTGTSGTPNVGTNPLSDVVNWKSLNSDFVALTGNQTKNGILTFTSFPITPSSAPTTNYQVANKKYVDDKLVASSETVSGIIELATTAESQAGTDDTLAITPLKLFNSLKGSNQLLSANGYQKLHGGLIIQWGTFGTINDNATFVVTFPISFVTSCVFASPVRAESGGGDADSFTINARTTSNMTVQYQDSSTSASNSNIWFAIGY